MKKIRKTLAWLAVVLVMAALAGCGGDAEKAMKEFASSDGTVSIMVAEDWELDESDGMMMANSKNGRSAVLLMQLPKNGGLIFDKNSMEDALKTSYQASDMTETDAVTAPEVWTGTEAYTCKAKVEGVNCEGYFVFGDTDYASYMLFYISTRMNDDSMAYIRKICDSFQENAPEIENNSAVEVTDTILWMNGIHAILTEANGWDYTMFGSLPANDDSKELQQELLAEWWDVSDRDSADETLDWLLDEGHRIQFVENMDVLADMGLSDVAEEERADFIYDNFDMTEEETEQYARFYTLYEEKGVDAMSAWDYSRVMSVLANCYIAGYYTETEALDKSLEIAEVIQGAFDSWDSFVDSYMVGYEYWAEESSDERRALYEEIKAASDSPYRLDWNLSLEKSW